MIIIIDFINIKYHVTCNDVMENKREYITRMTKSRDATILLSALIGLFTIYGIGHLYIHKTARGILLLLIGVTTPFILFISTITITKLFTDTNIILYGIIVTILIHVGILIWQTIDSSKLCNQYNELLNETGKPPW